MKNIKEVFTLILLTGLFSCKAQQTTGVASLYQMEECSKRQDKSVECPGFENIEVTHVKDTDNRLNAFQGTWKGSYNGKQIELNLIKKINFGEYDVKWDKLIGKIKVKDNQGNILLDTFSNPDLEANPYGYNFQDQDYVMGFWANGDCYDTGKLFLEVQQVGINNSNSPQLQLIFIKNTAGDITTQDVTVDCPNYATYQPLLPHYIKIYLTKQ